jgi:hypothetical protein
LGSDSDANDRGVYAFKDGLSELQGNEREKMSKLDASREDEPGASLTETSAGERTISSGRLFYEKQCRRQSKQVAGAEGWGWNGPREVVQQNQTNEARYLTYIRLDLSSSHRGCTARSPSPPHLSLLAAKRKEGKPSLPRRTPTPFERPASLPSWHHGSSPSVLRYANSSRHSVRYPNPSRRSNVVRLIMSPFPGPNKRSIVLGSFSSLKVPTPRPLP